MHKILTLPELSQNEKFLVQTFVLLKEIITSRKYLEKRKANSFWQSFIHQHW